MYIHADIDHKYSITAGILDFSSVAGLIGDLLISINRMENLPINMSGWTKRSVMFYIIAITCHTAFHYISSEP